MGVKFLLSEMSKFYKPAVNTVPAVNNVILCTLKYIEKTDFMLSVFTKSKTKHKRAEGNSGGDIYFIDYVYPTVHFGYGDDGIVVYACV